MNVAKKIEISTIPAAATTQDLVTITNIDTSSIAHLNSFDVSSININNTKFCENAVPTTVVSDIRDRLMKFADSCELFEASYDAEDGCIEGKIKLKNLTVNDCVSIDCKSSEPVEFSVNFFKEMKGAKKAGVLCEVVRETGCSFMFKELVECLQR